jgi:hypothetical protein
MDEPRVLARLDRIDQLERGAAAPGELLAELRGLLRDAEELARSDAETSDAKEEVVERLRTAPQRT